ncbi:hypothetical protein, partial [Nonomuraea rhizosphaerae]|uniref:hypothetical protein n=1 Tax=Nonomuraea rhizosphaerae TaxID=2665663 RepID=UPI003557C2AB
MDDLQTLAGVLTGPEPSEEMAARSRDRLRTRIRSRASGRGGWLELGAPRRGGPRRAAWAGLAAA